MLGRSMMAIDRLKKHGLVKEIKSLSSKLMAPDLRLVKEDTNKSQIDSKHQTKVMAKPLLKKEPPYILKPALDKVNKVQ
jgi:hypothetical protein